MKWFLSVLMLMAGATATVAETVIAARNIRSKTIITQADIKLASGNLQNGFNSITDVIGQETRVILYAGRPILHADIGPPALVERNQIVTLAYMAGPIAILTEGRSLGRAGVGESLRVLNLSSRASITGIVQPDGTVTVSNSNF